MKAEVTGHAGFQSVRIILLPREKFFSESGKMIRFQLYNDAVMLSSMNATLMGRDIRFVDTVDGDVDLTVNSTGITTFDGAVGSMELPNLTTDAAGHTVISGGFNATINTLGQIIMTREDIAS